MMVDIILNNGQYNACGDINGDGSINVNDINQMINSILIGQNLTGCPAGNGGDPSDACNNPGGTETNCWNCCYNLPDSDSCGNMILNSESRNSIP